MRKDNVFSRVCRVCLFVYGMNRGPDVISYMEPEHSSPLRPWPFPIATIHVLNHTYLQPWKIHLLTIFLCFLEKWQHMHCLYNFSNGNKWETDLNFSWYFGLNWSDEIDSSIQLIFKIEQYKNANIVNFAYYWKTRLVFSYVSRNWER